MSELILVGDRVLLEAEEEEELTQSGIVLPASVAEKDRVRRGRVVKVGPGYLMANPEYSDQPWRKPDDAVRYLPLQAQPGDLAYFIRKEAIELRHEGKNYLIVQHGAIVILLRPDTKDVIQRIQGMLD
ncbi:co-chaperone GroES [bacterium]|nr:co-chaperone GroES [bacterium]